MLLKCVDAIDSRSPAFALGRPMIDARVLLARLAVRSGLTLGGLQARNPGDFRLLMATAAVRFPPDIGHSERDVNDLLLEWLSSEGANLSADHVEVRRLLVDLGLLQRDGFGRRYVRPLIPPAPFGEAFDALAGLDIEELMASARADDARKRAERRARFAGEASAKPREP